MKTEHKIGFAAVIVSVFGIAVVVWLNLRDEQVQEERRTQDSEGKVQERQRQQKIETEQAEPQLHFVSERYEDGYTILTYRNKSSITPAAVRLFTFEISDPETLRIIERRDPKPREILSGHKNNIDDIGFTKGSWTRRGTYVFLKYVGYHVPPNGVTDFRLSIINRDWAEEKFIGSLEIEYSTDTPPHFIKTETRSPVTIDPKRRP